MPKFFMKPALLGDKRTQTAKLLRITCWTPRFSKSASALRRACCDALIGTLAATVSLDGRGVGSLTATGRGAGAELDAGRLDTDRRASRRADASFSVGGGARTGDGVAGSVAGANTGGGFVAASATVSSGGSNRFSRPATMPTNPAKSLPTPLAVSIMARRRSMSPGFRTGTSLISTTRSTRAGPLPPLLVSSFLMRSLSEAMVLLASASVWASCPACCGSSAKWRSSSLMASGVAGAAARSRPVGGL